MLSARSAVLALALVAVEVAAHGSLFIPPPRNSMDNVLPQWEGGKAPSQGCTCTNGNGDYKNGCDRGLRGKADGQACLWWNQGCSIGCDKCATDPSINGFPVGSGSFSGEGAQPGKIGFSTRYCNGTHNSAGAPAPMMEPTLPRHAWTLNVDAVEGSAQDVYRYNPWRAPGYAPVIDPCGQAGGKLKTQSIGGDSVFTDTQFAQMGDMGSKLPPSKEKTKWVAGTAVEVAWGPLYNHGGGYQYRLCSIKEDLTEECFQRTPLEFDRTKQTLVWNTKEVPGANERTPPVPANGTLRYPIYGVFVDEGTWPKGSTWARDPIPRINDDNAGLSNPKDCPGPNAKGHPGCLQFTPPCPWDTGMFNCTTPGCHGNGMGACSSDWVVGLISDHVFIPKDLAPGDYVLSWRWDCEETAQIWANCADVEIMAP